MSIKRYLFVLFGALILLLGVSQLIVSHYFKGQLQSELSESSRELSQSLVKVLIDNVGPEQNFVVKLDKPVVPEDKRALIESMRQTESKHEIESMRSEFEADVEAVSEEIARLSEELVLLELPEERRSSAEQKQQKRTQLRAELREKQQELTRHLNQMMANEQELRQRQKAKIAEAKREAADEYRLRLHEAVKQIEVDANSWLEKGNVALIESPPSPGAPVIKVTRDISVPNQQANSQLNRFSESMFAVILLTSIAGLVLAYLLSHVISAPLSALAKGHKKLGEGELGYQVEERGVRELKSILSGFNRMSVQLASLNEQKKQMAQQKQLAELGEVTRGIAHSLRNPLHTLGLLSEAIAQADSSQQAGEMLEQMQKKITMMDKSIQSLLTLSSTQVNRDASVPLAATVQDILLELSINGSKMKINFDCTDPSLSILGAESEIRSIVHAVLINAVEATPDSGHIDVTLSRQGDFYTLVVADTGKGIDPAVRDKLTQPHITTKAEGTGMGIYIAEQLIKGHYGGRIQFADNPGGGTVVTLYFSAAPCSPAGASENKDSDNNAHEEVR